MAGTTLGCGKYDAYVKTRGGFYFVSRITNLAGLTWNRKLNETSEASVKIGLRGISDQCCELISTINPWEHELSIFRDGQEVWCGPIVNGEIDLNEGIAQFDAKDLGAWFDKRYVEVASVDVDFYEEDITVIFDWLINHAYAKDPWNMDWYGTGKLNIPMDRTYVAYQPPADRWGGNYPKVGEELRTLADSGVDYTVVRRVMLNGNLRNNTGAVVRLIENHWSKLPNIRIVGSTMGTDTAIAGGSGGYGGYYDDQMWIERNLEAREKYGLLEFFEAVPDLDDVDTTAEPNAITERAKRANAVRSAPYEYLVGGTLSIDAPVTFDQLIPGRHIRIDLSQQCRPVQANYLLLGVKAELNGEEEEISLDLVPPGVDQLTE